jgi:hypothetical protein
MSFWVVKYDVKSLEKGATYHDMGVASPLFIRPSYGDRAVAEKKAEELAKSAGGEEVELVLANDKNYKGPRYVYRIAEDNHPPEEVEVPDGEETVCPEIPAVR